MIALILARGGSMTLTFEKGPSPPVRRLPAKGAKKEEKSQSSSECVRLRPFASETVP